MSLTTGELLLLWDQRRPRSQQAELGMSEVGGCQRRAKFRMLGTPGEKSGSIQAVLGTLIHKAIAEVLQELQDEGLIPAEDRIESEVEFAGIPGHTDHYEADTETSVDTKTTSQRMLDYWREYGIPQSWRFQTALYAAALVKSGHTVKWVRIDAIARDTGDEESFERAFDPNEVRAAMQWLGEVEHTPLERLPRAYAPNSTMCRGCPFRDPCWGEGVPGRDPRSVVYAEMPNAEVWAAQLEAGRRMQKEGEALAEEAKGVLDALRPNESGTERVDAGLPDKLLSFQVTPRSYPDMEQIEKVFAELGRTVPTRRSASVTLRLVKRPTPKRKPKKKEAES